MYFHKRQFWGAFWEKIWKHGDKESRKQIKGFIQLSGAIINNQYGKKHAVEYLLTKAIQNLLSLKESGININNLIDQINNYLALIHNDVCCSEYINIKRENYPNIYLKKDTEIIAFIDNTRKGFCYDYKIGNKTITMFIPANYAIIIDNVK